MNNKKAKLMASISMLEQSQYLSIIVIRVTINDRQPLRTNLVNAFSDRPIHQDQ